MSNSEQYNLIAFNEVEIKKFNSFNKLSIYVMNYDSYIINTNRKRELLHVIPGACTVE